VRKGETAIRIIAPMPIKDRDDDRSSDEQTQTRLLFKAVSVFDRSQVAPLEGDEPTPLEPPSEPLTGDSHAYLLAPMQAFTASLGFTVSFESIPGQTGGWCDQRARRIVVDKDQPANARLRILIHECAHALGVDYQQYSREQSEVLADTICFVACSGVGLAVDGESIAYVAGWGEDGALEAVTDFAATIDALARRIEDALNSDPRPPQTNAARPDAQQRAERGVGSRVVAITHYPPVDAVGVQRLRGATVA